MADNGDNNQQENENENIRGVDTKNYEDITVGLSDNSVKMITDELLSDYAMLKKYNKSLTFESFLKMKRLSSKQGLSFFGFGCDMRRAVIWVNIVYLSPLLLTFLMEIMINVVLTMIELEEQVENSNSTSTENKTRNLSTTLISSPEYYHYASSLIESNQQQQLVNLTSNSSDFDNAKESFRFYYEVKNSAMFRLKYVLFIETLSNLVAIIGACQYNPYLILMSCIAVSSLALYRTLFHSVGIELLFDLFYLYPHYALCYELWNKIITKENYHEREKRYCCCN
jgi:hypothetical protein